MKLELTVDHIWFDSIDVNTVPVEVIGAGPEGVSYFPNLAAARQKFPQLDPYRSTTNFTCAMRGEIDNSPALRFETWSAYEVYSS